MSVISNTELLSIQLETSYGTDPLSGADPSSFLAPVRDSVSIQEVITEVQDPSVFAVQATRESQVIDSHVEISFQVPLTGKAGTAGTAPDYAALLQACGLVETVNASTNVEYDPASGGVNAATNTSFMLVYYEFDDESTSSAAYEHRITGCRGNLQIILNQGEVALLQFDGQGLYSAPPTATTTAPTTPSSYQAGANSNFLVVQGVTNTIGGTTACFQSATFDLGWQVAQEVCGTSTAAVSEIYIHRSGNPCTVSYGLRADSDTIETWVGGLANATTYALVCTLTDGTDTVSITAPVMQPHTWSIDRGDGRKTVSLDASLHGDFGTSIGNDYIRITYT